jgi:signal transduction histidine kinase
MFDFGTPRVRRKGEMGKSQEQAMQATQATQATPHPTTASLPQGFEIDLLQEKLFPERKKGESLAEVAHDARNLVTALGLYCELLQEPGVLATPYFQYGKELGLLAAASRSLADKLAALGSRDCLLCSMSDRDIRPDRRPGITPTAKQVGDVVRSEPIPPAPIVNLAAEVLANQTLLAAIAGPSIEVNALAEGGAGAVHLTSEDLTRILVNLVRNAAEAMPKGGSIELALRESPASANQIDTMLLSVTDSGPGIPESALQHIFEAGFSTHGASQGDPSWPTTHRGLGLAITRSIVEAAGGRIEAVQHEGGARFLIELPVRRI